MAVPPLAAAVRVGQFKSSGTILSTGGSGSGFSYTFFAAETTIRGKNGSNVTFVGISICTGPPDQIPFNCLIGSGPIEGRLLTQGQTAASLNIRDAVAAGVLFQACDQLTCVPVTPFSPLPVQVTLQANGLFTNEFHGITRQTLSAGAATIRFFSNGQSTSQTASAQGRIGALTLPVLGAEFEAGSITDSKGVSHVIQRETKP
jgi:hypothetical protein